MNLLITGGAGFIGSNLVEYFVNKYPLTKVFNLDALTYAGNLENLKSIESNSNYTFLHGDISDKNFMHSIFKKYKFDSVIHLAAESHVDRSINDPLLFAKTNIIGTITILNEFVKLWKDNWNGKLFYHVSTDEVYGSLADNNKLFKETTSYDPNSPYAASKASSDHFVRAYGETYGMPFVISNCSNNYGQYQFPEKLIPLFINNILNMKSLPIYGGGNQIRDWLYVKDHVSAIDMVFHKGKNKETYNIGGFNEWKNIDLARLLCKKMDSKLSKKEGTSEKLIRFIKDRPGHDFRYAIDSSKINNDLGWKPSVTFEEGLSKTIDWYLSNKDWLENVTSGNYKKYYNKQYS